jgi:hypothetical protein
MAYTLASPLPSVSNFGDLFQGATSSNAAAMFKLSNGHIYLIYSFNDTPTTDYPQIWCVRLDVDPPTHNLVNLTTYQNVPMTVSAFCLGPDDKIYMRSGSYDVYVYDPETNTPTWLTEVQGPANYIGNGDDGAIYIGCQNGVTAGCQLFRYVPGGSVVELGFMESANIEAYYIQNMGADASRYVYCAIRAQGDFYHLGVFDRNDSGKTYFFDADGDIGGSIAPVVGGGWAYMRTLSGGGTSWYTLNGDSAPTLLGSPPSVEDYAIRQTNCAIVIGLGNSYAETPGWISAGGIEVDDTNKLPNDGNSGVATLLFRNPKGSGDWIPVTNSTIDQYPYLITSIVDIDSGNILLCPNTYGPVLSLNMNTQLTSSLGYYGGSPYNSLKAPSGSYLVGYPYSMLRYDPSAPYTQTHENVQPAGFDPGDAGITNPYFTKCRVTNGHYYYWTDYDADGLIWVVYVERSSNYWGLAWWSPVTGAWDSYDMTGEVFPISLCANADRTKMVYGASADSMVIFNVSTKDILRTVTNVSGTTGFESVVAVSLPGGDIWGVVVNVAKNAGRAFRYSISGNSFSYQVDLPAGNPFGTGTKVSWRIRVGPDGNPYMFISGALYQFNPDTGDGTNILTHDYAMFEIIDSNIHFYASDTTTNYKVIRGAFTQDEITPFSIGRTAHKVGGGFAEKVNGVNI